MKIPKINILQRLFNSYKIRCEKCNELLEFTTNWRSNYKWEIKKDYYNNGKHLKTEKTSNYIGYYVDKECRDNRVVCDRCF